MVYLNVRSSRPRRLARILDLKQLHLMPIHGAELLGHSVLC